MDAPNIIQSETTEYLTDPYSTYARIRDSGCPVQEASLDGQHVWVVTSYEDARRALASPHLANDPRAWPESMTFRQSHEQFGPNMLARDGEDHARLRRLAARAFTARRVARLRPHIEAVASALLDQMERHDEVELISQFAYPLPMQVICELLGVPDEDEADFRRWTAAIVTSQVQTQEILQLRDESLRDMQDYLGRLLDARAESIREELAPDDQPDLISAMLSRSEADDRLTKVELVGTLVLLLIAGHETTVNLIATGMRSLFAHPDQLELLLSRPDLCPQAVEELLRYDGPVLRSAYRVTTADLVLSGVTVPSGSLVAVVLGSANRDGAAFENADRLDFERPRPPHAAFGFGEHFCLGAPLARLEGQIALTGLLARFPGISLNVDADRLVWRSTAILRGLNALPVRLRK